MITWGFRKLSETQVLVGRVGAKGANKLAHMFDSTSPFSIILCEGSRFISLRIWLVEYS